MVTMCSFLVQAYAALLNAALKCGEGSLAVDVYRQMKGQGMPLPHRLFHTLIDVLVKIGKWQASPLRGLSHEQHLHVASTQFSVCRVSWLLVFAATFHVKLCPVSMFK